MPRYYRAENGLSFYDPAIDGVTAITLQDSVSFHFPAGGTSVSYSDIRIHIALIGPSGHRADGRFL